jgi:hypothetical protein
VLWEKNGEASKLLKLAKIEYAKGPKVYSEEEVKRESQFYWHKVLGLIDDKDTQYLFFKHQCVLRTLSLRLWFELLNKKFSQPLYFAMPLIEKADPSFYKNLSDFTSLETNSDQKIESAKQMFDRLFGN